MGQRVAVLRDGRMQQCGSPRELYNRPANVFVAGFLGSPAMNLLPAHMNGDGAADFCGVKLELSRGIVSEVAGRGLRDLIVGLRPESFELAGSGGIPAEVEVVEELGADAYAFCVTRNGEVETKLIARTDWRHPPERGDRVSLVPHRGEAHVFDPESGARLGE